jgi:hypothetical protein
MALTTVNPALLDTQAQYTGFKNRLINGNMTIDQRNAGASVSNIAGSIYTLDRWKVEGSQASKFTVQQNAGSVTPPAGYSSYLGVTSSSAYTVGATDYFIVYQNIEANNIVDFGEGTASAITVTASFWVRSSIAGTFGGVFYAPPGNPSYPFTYTINAINTWEQKTITFPGVTYGTWNSGISNGGSFVFSMGAGTSVAGPAGAWVNTLYRGATGQTNVVATNGATWYVTGVQLEKGSTATAFDYRPYGAELALCQRYFEIGYFDGVGAYISAAAASIYNLATFSVSKRSSSLTLVGSTGTVYSSATGTWGTQASSGAVTLRAVSISGNSNNGFNVLLSTSDPRVTGNWWISAEL